MNKVWFITGSSRGLGRTLTEAVLARGGRVAATARQPEQLAVLVAQYGNQILPLALDVTDARQITQAVGAAVAHFGRLLRSGLRGPVTLLVCFQEAVRRGAIENLAPKAS